MAAVLGLGSPAFPADSPAAGSAALEALQRLKGMDFEANPALKSALMRVLETTRGTPQFVELVRDFKLTGQEAGLLDVAAKHPADNAAAEAIRMVLGGGGADRVESALRDADADAERQYGLLQAIANSGDTRGVGFLVEAVKLARTPVPSRAMAIRGLAQSEAGARELLRLADEGGLDEAGRTTASLALAQARWPEIRGAAARVLPAPRSADGGELPTVPELAQMRGDPIRGEKVFRSEEASCSKCHVVGDFGLDFGPALSQIGTKLGRQALYESILDPSSGISFGYEGWSLETRDGEEVFGLLASETEDELAIKQQTGAVVRLKKSDVIRRERQQLSVMPAGLGSVVSRRDLVDLVEYLTTLRAPEAVAEAGIR